jgi:hypothetical protein
MLEWITNLKSTQQIETLADNIFQTYFNTDNSNEVNATLLEILPFYSKKTDYFVYVKSLAKQSAPSLKAQAIFTLAEIYTGTNQQEVMEVILGASNDTNLTVMVRNS